MRRRRPPAVIGTAVCAGSSPGRLRPATRSHPPPWQPAARMPRRLILAAVAVLALLIPVAAVAGAAA